VCVCARVCIPVSGRFVWAEDVKTCHCNHTAAGSPQGALVRL